MIWGIWETGEVTAFSPTSQLSQCSNDLYVKEELHVMQNHNQRHDESDAFKIEVSKNLQYPGPIA